MKKAAVAPVLIALFLFAGQGQAAGSDWWQLGYRPRTTGVPGVHQLIRAADNLHRYRINLSARFRVKENPRGEKVRIWLPLPADDHYQNVYVYRIKPAPVQVLTSRYGYRIAVFDFGRRLPGDVLLLSYDTEVTVGRIDWRIDPDEVGSLFEIPEQIRRDYLVDGPMYKISHPSIVQAAREAVGGETHPLYMMSRIALYVRNRLKFERDRIKWDAPTVLREGSGSCTEYSFLMIALARSIGLPARYMAGSTAKLGTWKDKFDDRVFHKIVEVYLPRVGWMPVESTRGLRRANQRPLKRVVGWAGMRMLFFVHEPEPGLAPLDPRRNVMTHVPFGVGTRLRVGRQVTLRWTRID